MLHAHIDGVNDFVAMIDLSYDGYKSPQRGNGLDYDHTVAILKLFAGFHGLALAFKHQEGHLFEQAASSLKVGTIIKLLQIYPHFVVFY